MEKLNSVDGEVNNVKIIGGTAIHGVPVGTIIDVFDEGDDGCITFQYEGKYRMAAPWEVVALDKGSKGFFYGLL